MVAFCSSRDIALDPAPHRDGIYTLTDTSGGKPVAKRQSVTQQFNCQGRLHRLHTQSCPKKRYTTRSRIS